MDEEWDKCTTMDQSGSWALKKLETSEASDATPIVNDQAAFYEDEDCLGSMVEIGDKVAVFTSSENTDEDYYIMLCSEPKALLTEEMRDGWGNVFNVGDEVLKGIYYEKLRSRISSYVLLTDAPQAIVHIDAVVAIKFPMARVKHKIKGHNIAYHLELGVHSRILSNMAN